MEKYYKLHTFVFSFQKNLFCKKYDATNYLVKFTYYSID